MNHEIFGQTPPTRPGQLTLETLQEALASGPVKLRYRNRNRSEDDILWTIQYVSALLAHGTQHVGGMVFPSDFCLTDACIIPYQEGEEKGLWNQCNWLELA